MKEPAAPSSSTHKSSTEHDANATPLLAVVNCAQLVTLRGAARPRAGRTEMRELGLVEDGAMLVRDGRIELVGTRSVVEPQIKNDCEVVDAGGRIVLPGFVDAHTHAVFAGTRVDEYEMRAGGATYQEIAKTGGGIRATVRRTRAATEDELVETAKRYARWFLRGGTTTIEAKSGYGLTVEDELKMLRAIRRLNEETPLRLVPTFLGAHEVPDEFRERRERYIGLIVEEMLPHVAAENLAAYCDVFCEKGVFDEAESRRILLTAKALGFGLRIHADQLSLGGGATLAAELGAATADHLEHTNAEGIAALRAGNVQPVLLPGAVYALGLNRYPPAREMIDAGLAVVLATDFNPGSSPTTSMQMILSIASTHMKMTPAESLTACTINAAYSLNLGSETGSLEAGKLADFAMYDCMDYRELAYFFGVEHTHAVYANGQLVYQRT
ncbi:MAG: imidazolonepropionase [Pyrinomonadaceae bacterium]